MRRSSPTLKRKPRKRRMHSSGAAVSGGTSVLRSSRSSSFKNSGRTKSVPIVRRVVLGVLLVASLALITLTYRGGSHLHSAQMGVLGAVSPIEKGMNKAWDPIANGWGWVNNLFRSTSALPRLQHENSELNAQIRILKAQQQDEIEVRRFLDARAQGVFPEGYNLVYGRVIGRGIGSVDRALQVNVGTSDGVHVDDAVMVTDGLIGLVTSVNKHNAIVGLILDSAYQPTVKIIGSEAGTGILQIVSTEGTPVMRIDKVHQEAKVDVGDEVTTAGWGPIGGLSSKYPANIPIGQVTSVGNSGASEYKAIQVRPYANFGDLGKVIILSAKQGMQPNNTVPAPTKPRSQLNKSTTNATTLALHTKRKEKR